MFDKNVELRQRCEWLLTTLMGKDHVNLWWNSTNRTFDNQTPESVFVRDPNTVYQYLLQRGAHGLFPGL